MSETDARQSLPERAADTTAESPWPVRVLTMKMADYIDRMSVTWVEGQVVDARERGNTLYLTLRDTDADVSLSTWLPINAVRAMGSPLVEGARVVVQAKPAFQTRRGTLYLDGRRIKPVGVGDLLQRIELLRRRLAAEGLFEPSRKRPLPFVPRRIGLITGRSGMAQQDVVENAQARWPRAVFEVRNVAVQGTSTVAEVVAALTELDDLADVDVIVIARGGGSFEDLLPFSNETMLRAVARAGTPVVSAIGHHEDTPLLDLVADLRASTPTDAGKQIVPDAADQHERTRRLRERSARAIESMLAYQRQRIVGLTSRPVLTDPLAVLAPHRAQIQTLHRRGTMSLARRLERAHDQTLHLSAQVRALSPQSTLDRGYAVVQHPDGRLVMDADQVDVEDLLRVRVARGDFGVRAVDR